jgi:methylase of polypeptide subunit release factors
LSERYKLTPSCHRQETATSVAHLASLIASDHNLVQDEQPRLRILDLCTGTGCIPLLFHNQFYSANPSTSTLLELVGVDISADALSLARENLIHQIANAARQRTGPPKRTKSLNQIGFVQANVLASGSSSETSSEIVSGGSLPLTEALERLYGNSDPPTFDVLISNPPYVSPRSYLRTTSRSVRDFEPKLALVPSRPTSEDDTSTGDYFYPRLWQAAADVNAKVCLFEVAGLEQATRVAGMALQRSVWDVVEIWRDDPRGRGEAMEEVIIAGQSVRVRGDGNGRSVFVRRTRSGA